jgi:hypothetical protein
MSKNEHLEELAKADGDVFVPPCESCGGDVPIMPKGTPYAGHGSDFEANQDWEPVHVFRTHPTIWAKLSDDERQFVFDMLAYAYGEGECNANPSGEA